MFCLCLVHLADEETSLEELRIDEITRKDEYDIMKVRQFFELLIKVFTILLKKNFKAYNCVRTTQRNKTINSLDFKTQILMQSKMKKNTHCLIFIIKYNPLNKKLSTRH